MLEVKLCVLNARNAMLDFPADTWRETLQLASMLCKQTRFPGLVVMAFLN